MYQAKTAARGRKLTVANLNVATRLGAKDPRRSSDIKRFFYLLLGVLIFAAPDNVEAQSYSSSQTEIGTLWYPNTPTFVFDNLPQNAVAGTAFLWIDLSGDFDHISEYVTAYVDGNFFATIDPATLYGGGYIGGGAIDESLLSDGMLTVVIEPSTAVSNLQDNPDEFVSVELNYDYVPVPEPSALAIAALGALSFGIRLRHKR